LGLWDVFLSSMGDHMFHLKSLALLSPLCLGWSGFAAPPAAADFIAVDSSEALPRALSAGLARIQAQALAAHIAYLADPAREGRGLGTKGLEASARYLEGHLAALGLPPLGKSYFQTVPLREIREMGGELRIELPGQGAFRWKHGSTCLLPELDPQVLAAPLVFAGYGIREEALGHDDFKNLDVKGKVVLLLGGLPPGERWRTPELRAKYGSTKATERYAARVELLDQMGAKAVIALEEGLDPAAAASRARPFFRPEAGVVSTDEPPLVRVPREQAESLLVALGGAGARPLPGALATLQATGGVRPSSSRNVIALLEGSDPKLKSEAVLLGAHMDHLGMAEGLLHPGADDNASGVSALLEIARAFKASPLRPRRTLIFAFWTGEEDGKFGSGHYVRHPLRPLARTSAYLNLDMIGHPWTAEELRKLALELDPAGAEAFLARTRPAEFAEPGFAEWAPELGSVLARAGRATGMALHLDRTDGCSGGSDYRDFARAHVPFVRFFGNYFPEYHEPGDTARNLDPAQVQRMARLAFATAWMLAER